MIRPVRLVKLYCVFPKELVDTVVDKLQDLGTVHLADVKEENEEFKLAAAYESKIDAILEKLNHNRKELEKELAKGLLDRLLGPHHVAVELGKKSEEMLINVAAKLLKVPQLNVSGKNIHLGKILSSIELLEDVKEKSEALKKFWATKRTAQFCGFAREEDAYKAMNAIDAATDGKCAFEVKEAIQKDNPPTLLSNPALIRPFEILTESYGTPPYNGVDPTFIMAITFLALFGIMFPDAGYGAVLALVSAAVYFFTRKATRFARSLNVILFFCGVSSLAFGLMFGEFLGGLVRIKPLLAQPVSDVAAMLIISLVIGAVHISLGLFSNILANRNRLQNTLTMAALFAALAFAYTKQAAFAVILAAAAALLATQGLKALQEAFMLTSHLFSYLRIGVLSMVHILTARLIAEAALALPRSAAGLFGATFLILIGTAASLLIGALLVFLQSLRLQWLEFFGMLEFGGTKFKPFRHRKEYIYE